ncbi:unnamed protein product [Brugia timori]|uniref:Uncharacterized protein n=1 Tax=Brugia timori TaxID=42155 RepID=A0A0R3QN22_9BILA|nr:unnamed protein product [Brugia timori]
MAVFGYRTLIDAYKRHLTAIGDRSGDHVVTKVSSVASGYCSSNLLSTISSQVEINGNSVLLATEQKISPTSICSSTSDDHTISERNGIIRKINSMPTQQLSTTAAMNLVKTTFTPPRENGEIGDGYVDIDNCSVVSDTAVVGHEQCNLINLFYIPKLPICTSCCNLKYISFLSVVMNVQFT